MWIEIYGLFIYNYSEIESDVRNCGGLSTNRET